MGMKKMLRRWKFFLYVVTSVQRRKKNDLRDFIGL